MLNLAVSVAVIGSHRAGWLGETEVADRWLLIFVNANLVCLSAVAFLAAVAGVRAASGGTPPLSRWSLVLAVGAIGSSELGLGISELTPFLGEGPVGLIEGVQVLARLAAVGFAISMARAQPGGLGLQRLGAATLGGVGIVVIAWQATSSTGAPLDPLRTSLILADAVAALAVVVALSSWLGEKVRPRELLALVGVGLYLLADLAYFRQEAVAMGLFFGELGYFGGLLAIAWGAAPDWERKG